MNECRALVAALAGLTFAACAAPYAPMKGIRSGNVGYLEMEVSADAYQVRFVGNTHTSMQQAKDFALLRAAELASYRGYRYFWIAGRSHWFRPLRTRTPYQNAPETSPVATITVQLSNDPVVRDSGHDAESIQRTLRAGYGIEEPPGEPDRPAATDPGPMGVCESSLPSFFASCESEELSLDSDSFRVTVVGSDVEDLALLRSAELALERDHPYFSLRTAPDHDPQHHRASYNVTLFREKPQRDGVFLYEALTVRRAMNAR